jgi:hypothetical protein
MADTSSMTEEEKMAQSLFVAMIIGWVICLIGLVVQPWVLLKARALRTSSTLAAAYQSKVKTAYTGALVYCVVAGIGLLVFIAMVIVSAITSK